MANDLRGTMEAYEFKNYILGLIFYKHLSDKTELFLTEAFEHDDITYEEAWKDEELREELADDMLESLGFVMEPKYLFPNVIKMVNSDTFTIKNERFTIQVANPPYSTKWSADPKFIEDEKYSPYGKLAPSSKADFAFIQHMIHHMNEGDSRIAVLLLHGVLFRGAAEETIRKYIIEDLNYLDAVIRLPANCFQGTSILVCCLVFKKERNGNSEKGISTYKSEKKKLFLKAHYKI